MHWLVYIGLIWAAIYVTSIVIAIVVNLILPVPPALAAISGLIGALIGVLYYLVKYAEHPVSSAIDELGRVERPGASLGDVVGEEDFGGIIEELRDQEAPGEEAEERQPPLPESE